jgi:hypothetical protein
MSNFIPYTVEELRQEIWEDTLSDHEEDKDCDCNLCNALQVISTYVD